MYICECWKGWFWGHLLWSIFVCRGRIDTDDSHKLSTGSLGSRSLEGSFFLCILSRWGRQGPYRPLYVDDGKIFEEKWEVTSRRMVNDRSVSLKNVSSRFEGCFVFGTSLWARIFNGSGVESDEEEWLMAAQWAYGMLMKGVLCLGLPYGKIFDRKWRNVWVGSDDRENGGWRVSDQSVLWSQQNRYSIGIKVRATGLSY